MVLSVLAVKLRHFGRKDVIEHMDFPQVPNSILEGLGRFADNHFLFLFNLFRVVDIVFITSTGFIHG